MVSGFNLGYSKTIIWLFELFFDLPALNCKASFFNRSRVEKFDLLKNYTNELKGVIL